MTKYKMVNFRKSLKGITRIAGGVAAAAAAAAAGVRAARLMRGNRTNTTRLPPTMRRPARKVIRKVASGRPAVIKGSPTGCATMSRYATSHKGSRTFYTIAKAGTSNSVVDQRTLRTDAESGFQEYGSLIHLGNQDMQAILNSLPGGSGSYQNNRFAVKSYAAEVLFSNNANMACELDIYDVYCKRDIANLQSQYDVLSTTSLKWAADPLGPVVGAIKYGVQMGTNGIPVPGTPPYQYQLIGSSLYDSPIFKDFFTIKKRTVVQLPQGGVHRHLFTQQVNRVLDKALLNSQYDNAGGSFPVAWKGLTHYTLWKIRGYPVSDASGTNITLARASVDCVNSRRWTYTYTNDIVQGLSYTDFLVSLAAGQESFVNPGSGAIDVVQVTT